MYNISKRKKFKNPFDDRPPVQPDQTRAVALSLRFALDPEGRLKGNGQRRKKSPSI